LENRDTPLHKAAQRGHTSVINLLLQYKVNPDIRNKSGETPLMYAAWAGKLDGPSNYFSVKSLGC
jgi:ankyrin repeat protein